MRDAGPKRSAVLNYGPHCTLPSPQLRVVEDCHALCTTLWSTNMTKYMACDDPMRCFTEDFKTPQKLSAILGVDFETITALVFGVICPFGNSV